jgi:hypothetical protein
MTATLKKIGFALRMHLKTCSDLRDSAQQILDHEVGYNTDILFHSRGAVL